MIKVYMDESGTHDSSPVVVVAGYVGRQEAWRAWTKRWNIAKRPIRVVHAVDAAALKGEFKGWTHQEVGALAAKLLPIISDSEIYGVVVSLDMIAFKAAMSSRDDLRPYFGTPYTACFHWLVQIVMNLAQEAMNKERIAFYHETNQYRGEAIQSFRWIQENGNRGGNRISLTFGGKEDFVALQAADTLAYEANKRLRDDDRPDRASWVALGATRFVTRYSSENMGELVTILEQIRDGKQNSINPGFGWNRSVTAGRSTSLGIHGGQRPQRKRS